MSNKLLDTFSKSRAEEYPADLWNIFVIPPKYKEHACLFNFSRAVMIEGGRGSGKTMFLRYHCHQTRFSQKRNKIMSDELKHVGLYFRPDTDFCSMINSFTFDENWKKVFTHYVTINLIQEFYSSIKMISNTIFEDISFEFDLLELETPRSLRNAIKGFPDTYKELEDYHKDLTAKFNLWINDIDAFEKPALFEPRTILDQLIDGLKSKSPELNELCFYIYIDEFENLSFDQQEVINNWMKHGQKPLIFNVAYKKRAKVNRATSSSERLVLRNDYRIVDLDKLIGDSFRVFAAEVLCMKLTESIKVEGYETLREYLCNEDNISERMSDKYQGIVLKLAKLFLPSISYKEMAADIVKESTLRKRVEKFLITPALSSNNAIKAKDFIDKKYPEESLINGLLLNRKKYSTEDVLKFFNDFRSDDTSGAYKSLIEQNLVGAILWVYLSASWKKCPAYAGFEKFCLLARGNIRHLLELCHQALSVASQKGVFLNNQELPRMTVEIQAEAAASSSRLELVKVDELGRHGEKLRFIANRLGLFFQLLQKRKSQSETEVNHFSIKITDTNQLDATTKTLLEEAVIWSVLVEIEGDTKRKSVTDISSTEYMLHPIYSPHFGISFRRKKKFEFSIAQIQTIFSGSESDYVKLCSEFAKMWDLGMDSLQDLEGNLPANLVQKGFWD